MGTRAGLHCHVPRAIRYFLWLFDCLHFQIFLISPKSFFYQHFFRSFHFFDYLYRRNGFHPRDDALPLYVTKVFKTY